MLVLCPGHESLVCIEEVGTKVTMPARDNGARRISIVVIVAIVN